MEKCSREGLAHEAAGDSSRNWDGGYSCNILAKNPVTCCL